MSAHDLNRAAAPPHTYRASSYLVNALLQPHICAGAGVCVSSVCAHRGPIHAVAALPRTHGAALLSAGKDHVIRLIHAPGLDAAAAVHSSDPGHQVRCPC